MEPWMTVDAHNGGMEAPNGSVIYRTFRTCRPVALDSHNFDEERDRIRIKVESLIRIRIKVKRGIRIRNKVMQFCNHAKMDQ